MAIKVLFWDWNGTLLDDTDAALATLNLMLAKRGKKPIGREFYRNRFAFPVKPFYETIGVCLEGEDWDALAREYHEIYARQPVKLNADALTALRRVQAAGVRQAIISALRQDILDEVTAAFGVAPYMEYIYGVNNLDGSSKLSRAKELMARLQAEGIAAAEVAIVGDALHDKEVADALGIRCVLHGQGSHAPDRLARVALTGETLLDAVALALG